MGDTADRGQLRQLTADVRLPEGVAERLCAWPPDPLVDLVLDVAEPWWRRKHCAAALAGRIPPGRADELLACALDVELQTSVRSPLLEVLSVPGAAHAGELLYRLRTQVEHRYGMDVAVVQARVALDDLSAADALAELAASPWSRRERVGREGLDTLIDRHGLPTVLAELGASSAEELLTGGATAARRLVALRLVDDLTPALGDPSSAVAREAYQRLAGTDGHEAELWRLVEQRGSGSAHLWALAVLHARGTDIRRAWEELGRPRVDLPGVPDDVRAAIVRRYVPGQRGTDPRWLLEQACLELPAVPDESELLRRAVVALAAAGLRPGEPVSAGDLHERGRGTYYVIATAAGDVVVSTLGPFVRRSLAEPDSDRRAREALVAAGFREIDDTLAATCFEGLCVYFFGGREPLPVSDLLFYWQD